MAHNNAQLHPNSAGAQLLKATEQFRGIDDLLCHHLDFQLLIHRGFADQLIGAGFIDIALLHQDQLGFFQLFLFVQFLLGNFQLLFQQVVLVEGGDRRIQDRLTPA